MMRPKGFHLSEEHKKKIGEANKGKKRNKPAWNKGLTKDDPRVAKYCFSKEETCKRLRIKPVSFLGEKHSEESKKRISKAKLGKPTWNKGKIGVQICSDETKLKMSKAQKGKKLSEEHKKKISETRKRLGLKPPGMLGKKHTEKAKIKMSESRKGKNIGSKSPLWRGGVTPINRLIRGSLEYRLWRKAVFERDNYTCQNCEVRSGDGKVVYLHPHHIRSFAEYPELRFDINNGVTYCVDCHSLTESYLNRWRRRENFDTG